MSVFLALLTFLEIYRNIGIGGPVWGDGKLGHVERERHKDYQSRLASIASD